jgi:hypothetical protein
MSLIFLRQVNIRNALKAISEWGKILPLLYIIFQLIISHRNYLILVCNLYGIKKTDVSVMKENWLRRETDGVSDTLCFLRNVKARVQKPNDSDAHAACVGC